MRRGIVFKLYFIVILISTKTKISRSQNISSLEFIRDLCHQNDGAGGGAGMGAGSSSCGGELGGAGSKTSTGE